MSAIAAMEDVPSSVTIQWDHSFVDAMRAIYSTLMMLIVMVRHLGNFDDNNNIMLFVVLYVDIDECQGDHGCNQECINDIGGFHCECMTGYQLVDMFTCAGQFNSAIAVMQKLSNLIFFNIDVDECIDSNGGCAQICNNTVGSFTCGCYDGYLLNSDEISCDGK